MTTGLGYGTGLVSRQTARNNDATSGDDIAAGEAVDLILTAVGTSGVGDDVLLVSKNSAIPGDSVLGVAEKPMAKGGGTDTAQGGWGHVIVFGMAQVLAGATFSAGDALAIETVTGRFMKATGTQVDAGNGVGVALADGTDGNLALAFVNFFQRANAAASGYGGAET